MLGVILCGGQSSRMGTDKGLLQLDKSSWAQTAVDKIALLGLPVVVSVNQEQHSSYASLFNHLELIKDDNALELRGPLLGVLSVHLQHPLEELFVLACDMPLMDYSVLKELLNVYQQQPLSTDALVFTNDGEPEPLCAIYTSKGLAQVNQLLKTKQLKKHSMKYMLEQVSTFLIPLAESQKKYFRNFNAHAELNGL